MNTNRHSDVQLATGFRFTDHLDAPYRLAYNAYSDKQAAMYSSRLNGSNCRKLFGMRTTQLLPPLHLSPDGTTLYGSDDRIWVKDLATGVTRALPNMPLESPFERTFLLNVSPDNRTLLLQQRGAPQGVPNCSPYFPFRLCRVSTNGTDFRVLVADSYEVHLHYVGCYWEYGFALVYRYSLVTGLDGYELCKVDLETGELSHLCPPASWQWHSTLRFNGKELAWSTHDDELYTCSLPDCVTRRLPVAGKYPAWTPDGKNIVFMQNEAALCLWDRKQEQVRKLVWFDEPGFTLAPQEGDATAAPAWSPNGRLLWFALTQTRELSPFRDLRAFLREVNGHLYPILRTLNRLHGRYSDAARHQYRVQKMGVVDFSTRQVLLYSGFHFSVTWLQHPTTEQG